LTERGYEPRSSEYGEGIIKCAVPVSEIKDLIDKGEAFVQDESSYICALTLGAMPGERVADVCACPGGKTFSTAVEMGNEGEIKAYDLHENKLSLIQKGAKRLGIDIVTVAQQNARVFVPENEGTFDRVLCDVPCSGLGEIFKKPDIKYKKQDSVVNLPSIQYDILSNCAKYVKVGGELMYSTCTLNIDENENVVNKFLLENDSFERVDFTLGEIKSENGMYTFFEHITGSDGFFVAKLRRVK
jgi:16S rRNA (cytosine967-C5)-methyltransferase